MKTTVVKLVILPIISLICSRTFFWLVDDPEGPNLLIVVALASIIYLFLLSVFFWLFKK